LSVASSSNPARRPTIIEPTRGWSFIDVPGLWEYRDLLMVFVERDVRIRYKQTIFGIAWAVFQPFVAMIVFSLFLGSFARVPSDGVPYPVFAYSGLLVWLYFADALKRSGESLVTNAALVGKVYFPRLISPLAGTLSPLVDLAIAFVVLVAMMLWYDIALGPTLLLLPVIVLCATLAAIAFGSWLAALNVEYRDIGLAIPFLVQIWLFLTPVVYPTSLVAERFEFVYRLNPMNGIVQAFRWAIIQRGEFPATDLAVSLVVVSVVLLTGLMYFRRVEQRFADDI
jgi:lipopolysaccharide transport system permease protein